MLPVPAVNVRFWLKSVVPVRASAKLIVPAPVPLDKATLAPRVTPRVKVILLSAVVISPEVLRLPVLMAPKVTAPPVLISASAPIVVVPPASISSAPVTPLMAAFKAIVKAASRSTLLARVISPFCTIVPPELIPIVVVAATSPPRVTLLVASTMFNKLTVSAA